MTDPRSRPNAIPWPPLVLLASLLIAAGAGLLLPLTLPAGPAVLRHAIGGLVALCGIGLDLWAMKSLHDGRTTVMPHRASSRLVIRGPYRFSRNPIYLGNTILLVGIGIAFNSLWFPLVAAAAAWATQKLAIEREERHLGALFGEEYEDYCRRVRRWL